MGTIAAMGGSPKLLSSWFYSSSQVWSPAWEWLWAGLMVLIEMQLLMYSE